MYILRTIVNRGWCPILLTAVAVVGYIYEWPIVVVGLALGVILVVGLAVAIIGAKNKKLELSLLTLKQ